MKVKTLGENYLRFLGLLFKNLETAVKSTSSQSVFTQFTSKIKTTNSKTMKFFQTLSVILAFSAATLVDARPQYGGSSSSSQQQKQKCRIVNDVEYVESVEQVCENKIQ